MRYSEADEFILKGVPGPVLIGVHEEKCQLGNGGAGSFRGSIRDRAKPNSSAWMGPGVQ